MRRELGISNRASKTFILPGSNTRMICSNALARLTGFSRTAWNTVKSSYKKQELPVHGLHGRTGPNANKTNADYAVMLHEFFQRQEATAEPRATKVIRDLVADRVEVEHRGDEHLLDLPAYITKLGLYKKLLAERQWQYTFNSKKRVIEKKKLSDDASKCPNWTSFRYFWKQHYPHLVIQKPSEDICGECHTFAHSYKTLNSKKNKAAKEKHSDDDSSSSDNDKEADAEAVAIPELVGDEGDGKTCEFRLRCNKHKIACFSYNH
jgi:hypothetical protein